MARGFRFGGAGGGVTPSDNFIYKLGDQYVDKTGGWSNSGWRWNTTTVHGSATAADTYLDIQFSTGLGTGMKVDLTNVSYIRVNANVLSVNGSYTCMFTINSEGQYYNQGGNPVTSQPFAPVGTSDFYIDVSSRTGSWYIAFSSGGSSRAMRIYEVELIYS